MGKVAITVDYEFDWGSRVNTAYGIEKMTGEVLEILEHNNSKATFFISTETAIKTKKNILDIHNAGHEIASHGHNHYFNYDELSKKEMKFQLIESKGILEDLTGGSIYGFRTPYFKKNQYTDELLLEANYKYDSSAVKTSLYGRYTNKQHNKNNTIEHFNVSAIYDKLPAGLKWINIFGNNINKSEDLHITYLHLFDLLSINDLYKLNNSKDIPMKYKLFYFARFGNILNTLKKISKNSNTLKSFLKKEVIHG